MPKIKLCPLKGKKKFEMLFDNGKKVYCEQALAIVLYKNQELTSNNENQNIIYYAVSISKKSSKKAVVRNRIKRLLRVSIRRVFSELSINASLIVHSFLIIWRTCPQKPSLIKLKDVQTVVKELVNMLLNNKCTCQ